jgi:Xaa-Pro aminopeptidase
MDYPALRRQRLTETLARENLDALLVSHPVNVSYLTDFSGDASHLILTGDRAILVSDARFTQQIAEECPGLETHIRPTEKTVHQASVQVLHQLGARNVGIEADHVTVAEYQMLRGLAQTGEWKPGRHRVEELRAIKDPSEVAQIKEAIGFAERAFRVLCTLLRPDDTEKELCDALDATIRRLGGTGVSFPSIVAVGERAALPHAPPTDRRVGDADLVLVDWGAAGRFYKSDLTRVLAPSTIPKQLADVHAVVAWAQQAALAAVRPGVEARSVDAAARAVIAQAGFGAYFGHGLGHGIGREVHEAPAVRPNSEAILQAGHVLTIEPGIYLPGWGGVRIEDDVLVTPDGAELLTSVLRGLHSGRNGG